MNCVFVFSTFPLQKREKDLVHKFKITIESRNQQMVYEGKKYFSHFLDLFESLIGTGRVRSRPSMTQEVRVTGSENNSRVPQGTEWGHLVKHFPVLNFTPGSTPWRRPMVTRCFWWSLLEVIQYSPPPCNLEFVRSLCFSPDIQIGKRDARAPRSFSSLIAQCQSSFMSGPSLDPVIRNTSPWIRVMSHVRTYLLIAPRLHSITFIDFFSSVCLRLRFKRDRSVRGL